MNLILPLLHFFGIIMGQKLTEKDENTKQYIFELIDTNQDKKLNKTEVFNWLMKLEKRKLVLESRDEWNDYKMQVKNNEIKWSAYKQETFGEGEQIQIKLLES